MIEKIKDYLNKGTMYKKDEYGNIVHNKIWKELSKQYTVEMLIELFIKAVVIVSVAEILHLDIKWAPFIYFTITIVLGHYAFDRHLIRYQYEMVKNDAYNEDGSLRKRNPDVVIDELHKEIKRLDSFIAKFIYDETNGEYEDGSAGKY